MDEIVRKIISSSFIELELELGSICHIWGRKELKEEGIILPTKHSFVGKQVSLMTATGLTSLLKLAADPLVLLQGKVTQKM